MTSLGWWAGTFLVMVILADRAAAANLTSHDVDLVKFWEPGPCGTSSWRTTLTLPPDLHATLTNRLDLNITIPDACEGELEPPFPVLIFFNGFQARASYYHAIAQRVASWGYVVAQYDTPLLRIFNVSSEMRAFEPLLDWLTGQNDSSTSRLYGQVDMEQVVLGGHSRGGKLAALLFAENPSVKAAFLVDPVDTTRFNPESPANPSATKALAAAGRRVGLAGAGIISSCNPEGSNWKEFWPVVASGSWLGVLPNVSHSQWMDAGCVMNPALDLLCGRGRRSRAEVMELTATQMLAWYYQELQAPGAATASQPLPQPLRSFFEWVGAQQAAERLEFSIKDGDLPEALAVGEEVAAAGEAAELAVATEGAGAEEC